MPTNILIHYPTKIVKNNLQKNSKVGINIKLETKKINKDI
jgi:hypothetical protein